MALGECYTTKTLNDPGVYPPIFMYFLHLGPICVDAVNCLKMLLLGVWWRAADAAVAARDEWTDVATDTCYIHVGDYWLNYDVWRWVVQLLVATIYTSTYMQRWRRPGTPYMQTDRQTVQFNLIHYKLFVLTRPKVCTSLSVASSNNRSSSSSSSREAADERGVTGRETQWRVSVCLSVRACVCVCVWDGELQHSQCSCRCFHCCHALSAISSSLFPLFLPLSMSFLPSCLFRAGLRLQPGWSSWPRYKQTCLPPSTLYRVRQ